MWTYLANAFRDGRGPALWSLGFVVGIIAGYATLALRLGISFVERTTFGVTEEQLASVAHQLPPERIILIPLAAGVVVALLLWLGQRLGYTADGRAHSVSDVLEARAVKAGRIDLMTGL